MCNAYYRMNFDLSVTMKKPGRNDPCPCGSGKKYKQCCQLHAEAPAARARSEGMPIFDAIQDALGFYQAGQLAQADALCQQMLEAFPLHPDVLHLSGMIASQMGKNETAVELIGKAIRIKPSCAMYYNLGSMLHDLGRLEAAVENYRKALALKLDFAEAHCNLGLVLKDQGKLNEAIESCRRVLALKPDFAEAYCNLGLMLKDQGKLNEAVESCRQALVLKPDFAEACNTLGSALKDLGKLDAAIACYRQALKLKPDLVEGLSNLGHSLREQGHPEAAVESFDKALSLKPDDVEAHIGLAGVHQDTGQFATAKMHLDRALALKPDHPRAWADLSFLRKMTPDDRPWAETAQHLLEGELKPQEEMRLCYALGKYNDDVRQYEAAFSCYSRATRLQRQLAGPFDRDNFRRFIDTIISTSSPEIMRQQQGGASASRRPLFIVGMPRSGTSLTEQILASHPEVFGAGELRFWSQQASQYPPTMLSWHHDISLLQGIASQCEAELQRHSATALRVVDKMPDNFLHLGLIHAVFPQARIIHAQRNPIDTCLSIYFQSFNNQHAYANDLDDLAFYYREYYRLMAHWRAVLPPEVFLDVPYEALIEDQEGWSRKIIGFIGLEWDERCLNFHETERKVGTASNWQVRQKIYQTSKERWRNYEKFVGPLLPLLELAGHHPIVEHN